MRLKPEERIEHNKKINAQRVKKHREYDKEHALEYNRKSRKIL